MFHKAVNLEFKEGTTLAVTFQSGEIKQYDMATLFEKYPQLTALRNRTLFLGGKLMGAYGIVWTDELDVELEAIYEDGVLIGHSQASLNLMVANALAAARASAGLSQTELAERSGINQADISKLERGLGNPSINTLNRIAEALGKKVSIQIA